MVKLHLSDTNDGLGRKVVPKKHSCNSSEILAQRRNTILLRRNIILLSHNDPCFQCNIAITNFLVSHTCEIRFHDVIFRSTVPRTMYSYAKIPKYG